MRNVVGLQAAFFSEAYVSHEPEKPDYLDYMCFPRICALARIAWRGNGEGWDAYYKGLVEKHYDRMAAMGIRFRLFPPKVSYKDGAFTVTADDGSEIYYTEGDAPEEHRYTRPVKTGKPHLYRFFTRYKTGRSPYVADKSYYRTLAPAVAITTSMGESRQFPLANAAGYKGLSRTARACRAAGLGALHLRAAGKMPRNVPPDRKPPAAEDHHNHRLCRGVVRRCDV